jgi:hypothetical protein
MIMETWRTLMVGMFVLLVFMGILLAVLWKDIRDAEKEIDFAEKEIAILSSGLRVSEKTNMKLESKIKKIEEASTSVGTRLCECMDALAEVTKLANEALDISRDSKIRCIAAEKSADNTLSVARELFDENQRAINNNDIRYELLRNETVELRAKILAFPKRDEANGEIITS